MRLDQIPGLVHRKTPSCRCLLCPDTVSPVCWRPTPPLSVLEPNFACLQAFYASPLSRWSSLQGRSKPLKTVRDGRRLSRNALLANMWSDLSNVRLEDLRDADIEFAEQIDRNGNPVPTQAHDSVRTVRSPRRLPF
jgi:hypothetical protein